MKTIYITLLIFLLFSCGNEGKNPNLDEGKSPENINTMVSPASEEGGGFGTPEKESGVR